MSENVQGPEAEYTPSTGWIRIMVGYAKVTARDRVLPEEVARQEGYEWFDRWLAAHDEQVRTAERQLAAKVAESLDVVSISGKRIATALRAVEPQQKEGN